MADDLKEEPILGIDDENKDADIKPEAGGDTPLGVTGETASDEHQGNGKDGRGARDGAAQDGMISGDGHSKPVAGDKDQRPAKGGRISGDGYSRPMTNDEKLKRYKKQSEERLLDIKRSREAKIGKRRSR